MDIRDELESKALNTVLQLLSRRSYAIGEIEQKLHQRGYAPATIAKIIAYCLERNYLNDHEYAQRWINNRLRFKPTGRIRLKQELKSKGIDEAIIEQELKNSITYETEIDLIQDIIRKEMNKKAEPNEKAFLDICRKLQRRGFTAEAIYTACRRVVPQVRAEFPPVD